MRLIEPFVKDFKGYAHLSNSIAMDIPGNLSRAVNEGKSSQTCMKCGARDQREEKSSSASDAPPKPTTLRLLSFLLNS